MSAFVLYTIQMLHMACLMQVSVIASESKVSVIRMSSQSASGQGSLFTVKLVCSHFPKDGCRRMCSPFCICLLDAMLPCFCLFRPDTLPHQSTWRPFQCWCRAGAMTTSAGVCKENNSENRAALTQKIWTGRANAHRPLKPACVQEIVSQGPLDLPSTVFDGPSFISLAVLLAPTGLEVGHGEGKNSRWRCRIVHTY